MNSEMMGGYAEMRGMNPGRPETTRRLACDAKMSRVITDADGVPLVGRVVRTVTARQRRALTVRDGGCRLAGRDRPDTWCDTDHIVHWAKGGSTDFDNVLLCRHHHTLIHQHRYAIHGGGRRPVLRRPDGTRLEDDPS